MKDNITEGLIRNLKAKMIDRPVEPIKYNPPEYDAHKGPVWVGCSSLTIREAREKGVEINSPIISLAFDQKQTIALLDNGIHVIFTLKMLKVFKPYVGHIVYHPYAITRMSKRYGQCVFISRKLWRVIDPKRLRKQIITPHDDNNTP